MSDRRSAHEDDALNTFWNDLIRASGAQDDADEPLSPETADAVRRLHHLGSAPPPASSRERVRRGLRQPYRGVPNGKEQSMFTATEIVRPGLITVPGPFRPSRPRVRPLRGRLLERPLIYAAVAAMLLTIIAGIAASQLIDRSNPGGRAGIPAVSVAGTPSPEAGGETLLEITIPAEAVPSGDAITPALGYNVLEPGRSGTWEPICCSGPMLEYVVSGVYTVRPESEIQVIRAGGETERIAAGAEATLAAGDALLTDITVVMESANHGTEPVDLLVWFLYDYSASPFGGKAFPGWVQVTEDLPWTAFDLTGPLTLRLRLDELEPDAVLEPEPGSLQMGVAAPGQTGYATNPMDDSIGAVSFDGSSLRVYVLTLEGAGAADATPAP
jgi:hypothetical protein